MLSLYLGRSRSEDRSNRNAGIHVRAGLTIGLAGGAARREEVVVHAPREPNHARALAAGEKLIEEVVLELVAEGVAVVSSYRPAALIVRWRD